MPRPSPQTDRVVTLLNQLAVNPGAGMSVAEISRRLGVNKATCYPMLAALLDAGWLVRHPARRTFHLGPALVPLGRAAADRLPTAELVHAALSKLSAQLDLACAAIAPAGDHVVVVDHVWSPSLPVAMLRPGQRLPFRPPWGAVFAAWAGEEDVQRWLDRGNEDVGRWQDVLAAIRSLGGVVELDESLADRVRDRARRLGVAGSRDELQSMVERLVEELAHQRHPVLTGIEDERTYPASSIIAPVHGPGGTVTLAIAAMGFPAPLPGTDVRRALAAVQAAAASLA